MSLQNEKFKTSVGGQALIEGLMMLGPHKQAMAVRQANGEIVLEELPLGRPLAVEKIPFLRGSVKLVRQMVLGMKALSRSADLSGLMDDEPVAAGESARLDSLETSAAAAAGGGTDAAAADDAAAEKAATVTSAAQQEKQKSPAVPPEKPEKTGQEGFLDRHPNLLFALSTVFAMILAIALFGFLPNLVTEGIRRLARLPEQLSAAWQVGLSFLEGLIRVLIFLAYLAYTRQIREIRRVWQYHGAEHKTISCYESGLPLDVEHARSCSRFHPRCGTSFLFLVMFVSVLVFSLTGWHSPWLNLLLRLLLLPVIAGISYEIIRWAGRSDSRLAHWVSAPGLGLQRLTTSEPDDSMLEVAITAMQAVLPEDGSDRY